MVTKKDREHKEICVTEIVEDVWIYTSLIDKLAEAASKIGANPGNLTVDIGGSDYNHYIEITGYRLETDEERDRRVAQLEKREAQVRAFKKKKKDKDYQTYLELKAKFEM